MNKRMVALCSVLCLVSIFLVGQLLAGPIYTNRERTLSAPMSIQVKSGDTTWALEVKDENEVRRFMVQADGTMSYHGTGGTTLWGVDANGKSALAYSNKMYTPTYVDAVGYTILGTEGNVYLIDADPTSTIINPCSTGTSGVGPEDGAGVTVTLPFPTAALDGNIFTFIKTDSTATDFFLYCPGCVISGETPIPSATGGGYSTVGEANVSSCTDFAALDLQEDSIVVLADFESAVSYWVLSFDNH